MVSYNITGILGVYYTIYTIFGNIVYSNATSEVCVAPEGYTTLNVMDVVNGKVKKGVTAEKEVGGYQLFHIDRELKEYRKVALCTNGHNTLWNTAEGNMIVKKKVGGRLVIAIGDRYDSQYGDVGSVCRLTDAFQYTGEFVDGMPGEFTQIKAGVFGNADKAELEALLNIACGGMFDAVGSHYPQGAEVTPHSEHVDAVKLGDVSVDNLTLLCGEEFYSFTKGEYDEVYQFDMDGAKYAALADVHPDRVNVGAMCKYGKGITPKIVTEGEPEYQAALLAIMPADVDVSAPKSVPHGIARTVLNGQMEEYVLDKYVMRMAFVRAPGMQFALGSDGTDTLWKVAGPQDGEVEYTLVIGKKGVLTSFSELEFAEAFQVLRDGTTRQIRKSLMDDEEYNAAIEPIKAYYKALLPEEQQSTWAQVKEFFTPVAGTGHHYVPMASPVPVSA